jgi:ABC-type Na+ transport system ATPase subunit NatA
LTKPDGGRAEVAGQDVVGEPNAVRRSIGYVPQSSVGLHLALLLALSVATAAFATWTFRAYQKTI